MIANKLIEDIKRYRKDYMDLIKTNAITESSSNEVWKLVIILDDTIKKIEEMQ